MKPSNRIKMFPTFHPALSYVCISVHLVKSTASETSYSNLASFYFQKDANTGAIVAT